MARQLQQTSLILLLLVSAVPLTLPAFLLVKQQVIYWQMMEQLEETKVTSVYVQASDIAHTTNKKEIYIKGELFDVREIKEIEPGYYLLIGLYDRQEQQLKHDLEKLPDNKKSNKAVSNIVQQLLSLTATIPTDNKCCLMSGIEVANNEHRNAAFSIVHHPIFLPPPEGAYQLRAVLVQV
jgi:hypothetical protein